MEERRYWLDLFTGTTWNEFVAAGGDVSGFRENRWNTVQEIRPGDYLLCYLTGPSRSVAVLLGRDLGFEVRVARNDGRREVSGKRLSESCRLEGA